MKKNLIIICNLVCLFCFLIVLLGCEQPASQPATPKIVRKKIRAQQDEKAAAPKAQPVRKSQPLPKSRPAAEPSVPEKQEGAPQPPVLAKKSEAPAQKTAGAAKSRPPVKPKSDISASPLPAPGGVDSKTAPGQPNRPDGPRTAMAEPSAKSRPIYNPKGKIDPFEPLFREQPTVALVKKARKKRIPRTPLEKIDLSQLRLVGIILASSGNKALVEESNGKGYVVKKGTYMGTNAGKVVQIEKDKVIVAEEYEDVLGNVSIRNKELKLPKPPGEF
jgi:type IV pilus assembly protein PilP